MLVSISPILLGAFASIISAAPTSNTIIGRAGGPQAKPIPSTCTIAYPIPPLSPSQGYIPKSSIYDVLLYSAYYPGLPFTAEESAEQCLQQCYGFGDSTQCKGVFWGDHVEVPPYYYNSPPGNYMNACIFFTRKLSQEDFDTAAEGIAFAANIQC